MPEPISVPRGSYCTRCRAPILPEDLAEYLANDHLCSKDGCAGVYDSDHAQLILAAEKRTAAIALEQQLGVNG